MEFGETYDGVASIADKSVIEKHPPYAIKKSYSCHRKKFVSEIFFFRFYGYSTIYRTRIYEVRGSVAGKIIIYESQNQYRAFWPFL